MIIKQDTSIIIGSRNGYRYMDNSRYLYEHILEYKPDFQVYWVTSSKNLYVLLKDQLKPVIYTKSIKGIVRIFKSKIGIYSNRVLDLTININLISKKIQLINLGHGAPIKKYRLTLSDESNGNTFINDINKAAKLNRFSIVSSQFLAEADSLCQGIPLENYRVTGYPRNDRILNPTSEMFTIRDSIISDNEFKKVILYAPTWRKVGNKKTIFFPFKNFEFSHLNEYLKKKNILLLFRPHLKDLENNTSYDTFKNQISESDSQIKLVTFDVLADVNDILPFVDILITDYSSILIDYLLVNKPCLFFSYDYHEFKIINGFLYDYDELLPGPIVKSFENLVENIDFILDDKDHYIEKRQKFIDLAHQFVDSKSCSRVTDLIDEILNEDR